MIARSLLIGVVTAEVVVAIALLGALVAASAIAARRRRNDERLLGWLGNVSVSTSFGPGADPDVAELLGQLRALPRRRRVSALLRVLEPLSGEAAVTLAGLARPAGVESVALSWCRSRRWARRLQGVRVLVAIGAGAELLPRLLSDPVGVVRAEAAGLAAIFPAPEHITTLLAMLEHDEPRCRVAAKDSLLRAGAAVTGQLADHLVSGEEITADALEVAAGIATPALLPAAIQHSTDDDPDHRLWATRVLAATAAPTARDRLRDLLQVDPSIAVRSAAAHGLAALADPSDAARLATALTDPAWDVRRTAALGLRQLGPAGRIYLRRALSSSDRFAADIARQVLDELESSGAA